MASRTPSVLLTVLLAAAGANAQSVIRTILGGLPDGIDALSATLSTPAAVASDSAGNIYAALTGSHMVVKIDTSGKIRVIAGNGTEGNSGDGGPGTSATLANPVGLAVDSAGNVYIADSSGNRVRRVTPDGTIGTFAGNGKALYAGDGGQASQASVRSPSALAFDPQGNLLIADTLNHTIRSVAPDGTITSVIGNGAKGGGCDDGSAVAACRLNAPAGVAADHFGNIFVADTSNNVIRVISPDKTVKIYAGKSSTSTPLPFGGGDTGLATNNSLSAPTSLATDAAGNLYLVEYASARVRRVTTDGKIASFAGTGTAGATGDGGLARYANIDVQGIAIDSRGDLLIAGGTTKRVRIVTAADGIINTVAGNGIGSYDPRGLAVSGNTLYFSDGAANRVRKLNLATGEITTAAGNGASGESGDGGPAMEAALNAPRGLTLDGSGNLYLADSANNWARKVTNDGKINVIAGTGAAITRGDGGSALNASLYEPYAVAVDSSGNTFVAERSGNVVRKVSSAGIITTVAGTGDSGAPTSETGTAINQKMNLPVALAALSSGSILVADSYNNRIRKLSPDGTITSVAGTGYYSYGGDGGPATAAFLKNPAGIAVDAAGNIYIADTKNHLIRRVDTSGIISTIAGTGASGYNGDGSPATAYRLNGPTAIATGPGCSLLIADTDNQCIRQLWPAVDYTITATPPGLNVMLDGKTAAAPLSASLLPGTHHRVDAPTPQGGTAGTRYVAPAAQEFDVACGPARAAIALTFRTQYSLGIAADHGGSVTSAAEWQDSGAAMSLVATAAAGFAFSGWEGACAGTGPCNLTMDGPKSVKANFAPAQTPGKPAISSGGVVGAGLSVPAVHALSPNGIAVVFGSNFAAPGTYSVAGSASLVNGRLSTELDGTCVLVGGVRAPVLALTPTQVNFQVPQTLASGTIAVQVATGCGGANEQRSDPENVPAQTASPEFFYFAQNASGQNPIAAFDVSSGTVVGTAAPAKPGDVLTLYANGLGLTNPQVASGELPSTSASVTGDLQVFVGDVQLSKADVLYAGVAPSNAGLYQLNIRLPGSTADGDQPVHVTVNGFSSPGGAYITVKR